MICLRQASVVAEGWDECVKHCQLVDDDPGRLTLHYRNAQTQRRMQRNFRSRSVNVRGSRTSDPAAVFLRCCARVMHRTAAIVAPGTKDSTDSMGAETQTRHVRQGSCTCLALSISERPCSKVSAQTRSISKQFKTHPFDAPSHHLTVGRINMRAASRRRRRM